MVLFLIGLGLGSADDITLRGLESIRKCSRVYLEAYTAILPGVWQEDGAAQKLEEKYGLVEGTVRLADREMVESGCEEALIEPAARGEDVALLVVGDPFSATTHTDLQLRAREAGVAVEVVHNASVMTAIGCCGLQLYRFGETISIVFFTDTWRPDSFYDKIKANRKMVRAKPIVVHSLTSVSNDRRVHCYRHCFDQFRARDPHSGTFTTAGRSVSHCVPRCFFVGWVAHQCVPSGSSYAVPAGYQGEGAECRGLMSREEGIRAPPIHVCRSRGQPAH